MYILRHPAEVRQVRNCKFECKDYTIPSLKVWTQNSVNTGVILCQTLLVHILITIGIESQSLNCTQYVKDVLDKMQLLK